PLRLRLHRRDDRGMRVAQDERAPRPDMVEIAGAVGVPDVRAFAARDEARRAADGAERAHRRVHAAGHEPRRALEEGTALSGISVWHEETDRAGRPALMMRREGS